MSDKLLGWNDDDLLNKLRQMHPWPWGKRLYNDLIGAQSLIDAHQQSWPVTSLDESPNTGPSAPKYTPIKEGVLHQATVKIDPDVLVGIDAMLKILESAAQASAAKITEDVMVKGAMHWSAPKPWPPHNDEPKVPNAIIERQGANGAWQPIDEPIDGERLLEIIKKITQEMRAHGFKVEAIFLRDDVRKAIIAAMRPMLFDDLPSTGEQGSSLLGYPLKKMPTVYQYRVAIVVSPRRYGYWVIDERGTLRKVEREFEA